MTHPRLRPLGIALTLLFALAAAAPAAARPAGRGEERPVRTPPGFLERTWDRLAGWTAGLPGAQSLARVWAGDYGGIDPNGAKPNGTAPIPPLPGIDPAGQP